VWGMVCGGEWTRAAGGPGGKRSAAPRRPPSRHVGAPPRRAALPRPPRVQVLPGPPVGPPSPSAARRAREHVADATREGGPFVRGRGWGGVWGGGGGGGGDGAGGGVVARLDASQNLLCHWDPGAPPRRPVARVPGRCPHNHPPPRGAWRPRRPPAAGERPPPCRRRGAGPRPRFRGLRAAPSRPRGPRGARHPEPQDSLPKPVGREAPAHI
jgi:hypothetical protein